MYLYIYMYISMSISNFETDFAKAKSSNSAAGGACIFVGWLTPILALLFAAYAFNEGSMDVAVISIGASILFLFFYHHLLLFEIWLMIRGTNFLIELQTWQQQKAINPELVDFKLPSML